MMNNYFVDCIEQNQFNNSSNQTAPAKEKVESQAPKKDNTPDIDLDVPF